MGSASALETTQQHRVAEYLELRFNGGHDEPLTGAAEFVD